MRILAHLSKGKAWETALAICKELQQEYETTSFNYSRLSELLVLQSELYANIAKSDRHFGFAAPPLSKPARFLTELLGPPASSSALHSTAPGSHSPSPASSSSTAGTSGRSLALS